MSVTCPVSFQADPSVPTVPRLGAIAIGRNEGDRLIRCLESLLAHLPVGVPIIYVDSGSTDSSIKAARDRGVHVVELDMSIPFTGARARNAGFRYLMDRWPKTQFVQFIDGDCELLDGWVNTALEALRYQPDIAVVFGRLRERFPKASPYNQLADLEWNKPAGETDACGGISLMRTAPLQAEGGFNPTLICGEEPELCLRLRRQGRKIRCLPVDMAIHDMDMHRFSQWWKRSVRAGWAIAEGKAMYGSAPERYKEKEHLSGWVWGALLPVLGVALLGVHAIYAPLIAALYGLQLLKIYSRQRRRGLSARQAFLYARFCLLSKFPQAVGQLKFWLNRWQRQPAQLIEYK